MLSAEIPFISLMGHFFFAFSASFQDIFCFLLLLSLHLHHFIGVSLRRFEIYSLDISEFHPEADSFFFFQLALLQLIVSHGFAVFFLSQDELEFHTSILASSCMASVQRA